MANPRSSLQLLAEKLPIFHPQPRTPTRSDESTHFLSSLAGTPRASRDWSLENDRRTSIGLPTPSTSGDSKNYYGFSLGRGRGRGRGHRRQLSLSSFSVRGVLWGVFLSVVVVGFSVRWLGTGSIGFGGMGSLTGGSVQYDDGGAIPWGQSRERGGREVFWWEGFESLIGYYNGWKQIVRNDRYVSEQDAKLTESGPQDGRANKAMIDVSMDNKFVPCYIDEERQIFPPRVVAFEGLPQGFPSPLFGSHEVVGLKGDVCYDRINRFGPYGFGFSEEQGGLGVEALGDIFGRYTVPKIDYRDVHWSKSQQECLASKRYTGPRTAFIIRTWHSLRYSPFQIMMLRAIVSELALATGGKYTVHFLIHVQDDTIPIWASEEVYNKVLAESLPAEFAGMGTLWSVAQMKLIYPPPFPESIVNFSGDDLYKAYRSLHFPLQYFAQKHPEFEYFWHWEMDIRVTGGYLELLEQVTKWAEKQERDLLWEKSSKFYIPNLFQNSYAAYEDSVRKEVSASGQSPISGPQLATESLLSVPGLEHRQTEDDTAVDLITFSPLFDPTHTRWAFHDDITGYQSTSRPPTRASLITATRLSRRLLLTMHHETFQNKHTMFPEMFPASIALHYGYKAVYAPLPIYSDRDWPAAHADEVFNNAVIGDEGTRMGMLQHGAGRFHGDGGSVFGPGEHVFRGVTWYSNAQFAGYLWRRWLGRAEGDREEIYREEEERGRMCLPMMVLHPVKDE